MTIQINMNEVHMIGTCMLEELNQICTRNKIKYFVHAGSALGAVRHKGPIPWDDDIDILFEYPTLCHLLGCLDRELSDRFTVNYYDRTKGYRYLFPRIGLKDSPYDAVYIDLFPLVGLPDGRKEQVRFSRKSDWVNLCYMLYDRDIGEIAPLTIRKLAKKIFKSGVRIVPKKIVIAQFEQHCEKYPYDKSNYVMNPCGGYGVRNIFPKGVFEKQLWVDYVALSVPVPEQYDYYLKQYYGDYMQFPPVDYRKQCLKKTVTISKSDFANFDLGH